MLFQISCISCQPLGKPKSMVAPAPRIKMMSSWILIYTHFLTAASGSRLLGIAIKSITILRQEILKLETPMWLRILKIENRRCRT